MKYSDQIREALFDLLDDYVDKPFVFGPADEAFVCSSVREVLQGMDPVGSQRVADVVCYVQGERIDLGEITCSVFISRPANPPPNPQLQPLRASVDMSESVEWNCPTDLKIGETIVLKQIDDRIFHIEILQGLGYNMYWVNITRDRETYPFLNRVKWNTTDARDAGACWRRICSAQTNSSHLARSFGATCTGRCKQHYPDAEPRVDFVCWECRNFY